jgi:hypothetical protein
MRRTAVLPSLLLLTSGLLLAGCPADKVQVTGSEPDESTSTSVSSTTRVLGGTATGSDEGDEGSSDTTRQSSATTAADGDAGTGSGNKVVLRGSSFGAGAVGDEADGAIAAVTKSIGRPSDDDTSPGAKCPGADRYVTWGRFSLAINDDKVIGWGYADSPAGPPHLSTSAGITTGSTLAAVKRAYPDKVTTSPGVESYPASFEVSGVGLGGYLTGTSDTAKVTYLYGGTGCGD